LRIAIVSDIHGNLLALDAVMSDLERQSPDQIWCGGDLGWGGSWASECIARVRQEGWVTVKGNTDVWIAGDPQTLTSEEERRMHQAMAAQHNISKDDAEWLVNLPIGHSAPGSLLLVHGTPRSPFEAPMPSAPAAEFAPYRDQAKTVFFGHVHCAYSRRLSDGTLVCNTGSVGLPMDGDTACYLIVDQEGTDLTWQHRRVEFDRRAVEAEARRTAAPLGPWLRQKLGIDP
jgi:predicted phosphodiesterase